MREKLDSLTAEMFDRGILLDDAVREVERRFIARALQSSEGRIAEAADRLGMHRNTLARKIAEYKLRLPR